MLIFSEKWDALLGSYSESLQLKSVRPATTEFTRGQCLIKHGLGVKLNKLNVWVFHRVIRTQPPEC